MRSPQILLILIACSTSGLTFGTVAEEQREESRASWGMPDVFWSGCVLVGILAAYLYFRG